MAFRFADKFEPNMAWTGLSKSLSQAMAQVGQMKQMEQKESMAHETHQREMNQLLGLKDQGLMTGEEYNTILDKANADAQESGAIRAYENFSMYDELDKSRANIRLNALDSYLNTPENIALMTHVTDAVSPEAITQKWVQDNEGKAIGKDLAGDDVFATASGRPSELIAFSSGLQLKQLKLAVDLDKVRVANALEVNEGLYGMEIAKHMKAGSDSEALQAVTAKFKGMGVTNLNALTLTSAADIMDNWVTTLDPEEALDKINLLEYQLTQQSEMRPGAGIFAAEGTENGYKLTNAADAARTAVRTRKTALATARKAQTTEAERVYSNIQWDSLNTLAKANNGIITDTDKASFKQALLEDLNQPMYVLFDKSAIIKEFDNFMDALDVTETHEEYVATYTTLFTRNQLNESQLQSMVTGVRVDFNEQKLNYKEFDSLMSELDQKIRAVRTDKTTSLQATLEKEGSMGWTSLPSDTLTETEDLLKSNNYSYWDSSSETFKTAGGKDDMYFRSFQRGATEYAEDLLDAGLYGGSVPAPIFTPFTAEEILILPTLGVPPGDIEYNQGLLAKEFVVQKAPTTVKESRRYYRQAVKQARAYAAVQAYKQLLYFNQNPEFKAGLGTIKPSTLNK
jgi:hypothetical protein